VPGDPADPARSQISCHGAAADRGAHGGHPTTGSFHGRCAPPPPRCGMEALPAGDEKPAGMRCRFCNRPGRAAKGSRRGRKRVRFHRCERTQPRSRRASG
jgi:hypothetical protein